MEGLEWDPARKLLGLLSGKLVSSKSAVYQPSAGEADPVSSLPVKISTHAVGNIGVFSGSWPVYQYSTRYGV